MGLYRTRILCSTLLLSVLLAACGVWLLIKHLTPPPPPPSVTTVSISAFPAAGEQDSSQYYVEGQITNFDSDTMYVFVFAVNPLGEAYIKPFANTPLTEVVETGQPATVTFSTRVHTDDEDTEVERYTVLVVRREDVDDLFALGYADLSSRAIAKQTVKRT